MKTCLITGGTGLIGSHLIKEICNEYKIYALVQSKDRFCSLINQKQIEIIEANLAQDGWQNLLPKKIDHIIHLAQSPHYRFFPEKAKDIFHVNVLSLFHLLEYAKKATPTSFLHASTGGIYGWGNTPFSASSPYCIPPEINFYSTTKLCAELISSPYSSLMNIISLRFFFVYGKGQKENMLIPRLIHSISKEKPILLQGEQGILINPIHVEDAVAYIKKALLFPRSSCFNIAGNEILSLHEIGKIIGKILNKLPLFQIDENATPRSLIGDIKDTIKNLNYSPKISFKEGIERTV